MPNKTLIDIVRKRNELELHPDPGIREYQEKQLTASEYWNYVMRYGERRMTKDEWKIWKGKKDMEEKQRNDLYFEIKFGGYK